MVGAAGEQIEGVRDEGQDGVERCLRAGGTARQIDDEGVAEGAADGAAERGKRGVAEAFGAHEFGQSFDEAFADLPRGLGGDVAGCQTGAAGGDNQLAGGGVVPERRGDPVDLVGESLSCGRC